MFTTVHRNDLLKNLDIANLRAFNDKVQLIRKYMTHDNCKIIDVAQSVIDGRIYVFVRGQEPTSYFDLVDFNVNFDINYSGYYENTCYIAED